MKGTTIAMVRTVFEPTVEKIGYYSWHEIKIQLCVF